MFFLFATGSGVCAEVEYTIRPSKRKSRSLLLTSRFLDSFESWSIDNKRPKYSACASRKVNTFLSDVELCFMNFPSVARSSAKSLRYGKHAFTLGFRMRIVKNHLADERATYGKSR